MKKKFSTKIKKDSTNAVGGYTKFVGERSKKKKWSNTEVLSTYSVYGGRKDYLAKVVVEKGILGS